MDHDDNYLGETSMRHKDTILELDNEMNGGVDDNKNAIKRPKRIKN